MESRHLGGGVRSGESDATLRFESIDVHSNDTATLRLAWPLDLIPANTTIDLLVATSLVNSAWTWQCGHVVGEDDTNWTVTVALPETSPGTAAPSAFYRAVHRETCADTMDDLDGDGIPGAYELAHGTNPYVADAEDVPRLTVGADGQYATIQAALAASVPYSVIELDADTAYAASGYGYDVPQHPVMITAPRPYAVVRSTGIAAFMLANGSTSRTLFRNLYLLLDAKSSFQVGFWCGGNLPTIGTPASATFENVYVRMPNAGVQYRGWLFYRNCADMAVLRNCTLNAAGATWIYGVDAFGSPPILFDRCSFVNFPEDSETSDSYGIVLRTNASSDGGAEVTANRTLFDESFADAWPLGRADSAKPYLVTACGCILPRAFPATHCPDAVTGTVVTNAALAWCGVPRAASPSAALGIGSLTPIANDPNADSDGDGLCDYGEAYVHGSDPWLADSDRDGVPDAIEILEDDTDPADPHSFQQRLTVTATNTASLAFPIRVAWGYSGTGWETNGLAVFAAGFGETAYTNASSHGATHVKAFCDINGNGTFEADCDILIVRPIPSDSMAQVRFTFGDVDGDGVPDAQEREDGTNPYDKQSFRLVTTVNFLPCGSVEWLTNYVAWGYSSTGWETNGLASFNGTNHLFEIDETVTNGKLYAKVFRDYNTNGVYDAGADAMTVRELAAADRGKTVTVGFGDENSNLLPDWWEVEVGLDAEGLARRAYDDPDGDGLVNLHEYWAGTDPLVPDGSNTLLSVISRSIDDLIRDRSPDGRLQKFLNYHENGANGIFVLNTNCWANGIDTSCVSMWNNSSTNLRAGVAISKRHILVASHYYHGTGVNVLFHEPNGNIHTNVVTGQRQVNGTDVMVQSLRDELPDTITPARILPPNYREYLGGGQYWPVLRFDQDERCVVCEVSRDFPFKATYKFEQEEETFATATPSVVLRQPYYIHARGGDSGNPSFLVVGNEVVLLGALHGGNRDADGSTLKVAQSPFATYYSAGIQDAMDYLIHGYTLQFFDCSPYQTLNCTGGL